MEENPEGKGALRANEEFYRAFESLDLGRMEALWARGEGVWCIHPGWGLLTGWDQVIDSWSRIFENTSLMQFRITDAQVQTSRDLAMVVCLENITSVVDGNVSEFKVLSTNAFMLREGSWLMVHHHGSPVYRA
jgi:ketosteroid isomerase-like protein